MKSEFMTMVKQIPLDRVYDMWWEWKHPYRFPKRMNDILDCFDYPMTVKGYVLTHPYSHTWHETLEGLLACSNTEFTTFESFLKLFSENYYVFV